MSTSTDIIEYDINISLQDKLKYAVNMTNSYRKNKDTYLFDKLDKEKVYDLLSSTLQVVKSLDATNKHLMVNTTYKEAKEKIEDLSNEKYSEVSDILQKTQDTLSQKYSELLIKAYDNENDRRKVLEVIDIILKPYPHLTGEDIAYIKEDILGFGPISDLMDPSNLDVEEIQINDYNDIKVISGGRPVNHDKSFDSPYQLQLFVDKLINRASKQQSAVQPINGSNPCTRIRLGESTRISMMGGGIAGRPVDLQGKLSEDQRKIKPINICIRRQRSTPITTKQMLGWNSTDEYQLALLSNCIGHGVSVMGFGMTGSGKTAMFRAIIVDCVPEDLRIITVAETDEMQLRVLDTEQYLTDEHGSIMLDENGNKIPNNNYMKPKINALMWEIASQDIKILGKNGFLGAVNATLTFTPEMIIFQETKGGEIKDLIEEAVSGHQVITTIHVSDAKYVPLRVLLMYQQSGTNISDDKILQQVPAAFPLLVEFKRYKDGSRKIASINELVSFNIQTQEAILRPLSKFVVDENIIDENGKRKVIGRFVSICDPLDESEGNLLKIMKDNFLTQDKINQLRVLYEKTRDANLISQYEKEKEMRNKG